MSIPANLSSNIAESSRLIGGTSSTTTQNSATAPFWIHAKLLYDSVSGLLTGTVDFYINKVITASVTLSNFITGISDANDPVTSFSFSVTSSGAASGTPTTINVQAFTAG